MEPWKRPRFADLVHSLESMKYSALMKVILTDLSRLDLTSSAVPAVTTDTAMDREALENILGGLIHDCCVWWVRSEKFRLSFILFESLRLAYILFNFTSSLMLNAGPSPGLSAK